MKGYLLIISVLLILPVTAFPQVPQNQNMTEESTKEQIIRKASTNWIQVGQKQYGRGFFAQAEKSFLHAKDYFEYLTIGERKNLDRLLESAHNGAVQKQRAFPKVPKRINVAESIKNDDSSVVILREKTLDLPYSPPLKSGNFEQEASYASAMERKKKIQQSYARAVIKDSVAKAELYTREGRFYKAKEAIEAAQRHIDENQSSLEQDQTNRYRLQLDQLSTLVTQGRARWLGKSEW